MKKTLSELAVIVQGELVGDGSIIIHGATNIEDANENSITFAVSQHTKKAENSSAGAAIIPLDVDNFAKPCIKVANPRLAFTTLLEIFSPTLTVERIIHPQSYVSPTAKIGNNVAVMPFAFVDEGAVVGDNTILFPNSFVGKESIIGQDCLIHANSVVREFCQLGDRVVLQNGSIVGGDGFGFITVDKRHRKVPQVGNVVIHDDVEIGCNTCIDRATTGSTIIGRGTKIDNLVHIAHNDVVGENCFFVAQVGISGSVHVGDNVTFAGQVGSAGHLTIGSNCTFAARSGITNDIPANSFCAGFPARPHREWLKMEAYKHRLPDTNDKIKTLEKRIAELENKLSN